MKKSVSILFLFLTVFLIFSCASCMNKENKLDLVKGKTENNVYVNDYLGFKFIPGLNWYFSEFEEEDVSRIITDMYAVEKKTGEYVRLRIEDLSASFGGTLCDEADYAEIITEQLENAKDPSFTTEGQSTVLLCGKEYMEITVREAKNKSIGYRYLIKRFDDYMITIVISDYIPDGENNGEDYLGYSSILSMFLELNQ